MRTVLTARAWVRGFVAVLTASLTNVASAQSPARALHALNFYIHEDVQTTLGGPAAATLLVEQAIADAGLLLEGDQGPTDTPCCTGLELSSGVSTLVDPSNQFFGIDFDAERDALLAAVGNPSGPSFFVVDHLDLCGSDVGAVGCADLSACAPLRANPVAVITLDAILDGVFGQLLAHERGHHACLVHTTVDASRLMSAGSGGGSLSASECNQYRAASTSTGGSCVCHADPGVGSPDLTSCNDGATAGICSGALCGEIGGDASVELVSSADPNVVEFDTVLTLEQATYDRALRLSGASGGWSDAGATSSNVEYTGLAYADDRALLYGVIDNGSFDELAEIDPATGAILGTHTLSVGDVTSLAYDPGPTASPADDELFALFFAPGIGAERLLRIDPDDGTTLFDYGFIEFPSDPTFVLTAAGRLSGLAYDPVHGDLYMGSLAGLYTIDLASCMNPGFCGVTEVLDPHGASLPRYEASLAYSSTTGNIYMVGNQQGVSAAGGDNTTLFTVIEGGSARARETVGISGHSASALAAIQVAEPDGGMSGAAVLGLLAWWNQRSTRAKTQRKLRAKK